MSNPTGDQFPPSLENNNDDSNLVNKTFQFETT